MKRPLTPTQIKTMFAIAWIRFLRGYPPSFRELCQYCKVTVRVIWDRRYALVRKGVVACEEEESRTIRITPAGLEALKGYGFRPTTQELYKKMSFELMEELNAQE